MVCWEIMDVLFGLFCCFMIFVVEDNCWLCFFVIVSVILVFIFLVGVWDSNDGEFFGSIFGVYVFGFFLGIVLGGFVYFSL